MPATTTDARRGWYFLASDTGTVANPSHAVPGAGRLVTACTRQTRAAVAVTVDEYAVEPVPTGRPDVVSFYLAKLGPADAPADVYEVTGGANGRTCSCPADPAGQPCKHLPAVAGAIAAGGLPGPKKG